MDRPDPEGQEYLDLLEHTVLVNRCMVMLRRCSMAFTEVTDEIVEIGQRTIDQDADSPLGDVPDELQERVLDEAKVLCVFGAGMLMRFYPELVPEAFKLSRSIEEVVSFGDDDEVEDDDEVQGGGASG